MRDANSAKSYAQPERAIAGQVAGNDEVAFGPSGGTYRNSFCRQASIDHGPQYFGVNVFRLGIDIIYFAFASSLAGHEKSELEYCEPIVSVACWSVVSAALLSPCIQRFTFYGIEGPLHLDRNALQMVGHVLVGSFWPARAWDCGLYHAVCS